MSFKYRVLLIVILAIFTRFFGLNWGSNYFFNPDENNMAVSISQLNSNNLNPHFFSYGQFPLYLGYYSLKAVGLDNNFANSIFILRFYSAFFSVASLYFFYKIYSKLSFVILLIFTPGLIQLAHFGTTESLLIFIFSVNLYLTKLILERPRLRYFFIAALCTGAAIATKISGAVFALPIIFAALLTRFWCLFPYALFSALYAIILSPYSIYSFPDFISAMNYETTVANGSLPVFYTAQFQHTIPYLFQITKIFPYTIGLPVIVFALISLFQFQTNQIKNKKFFWIVLSTCLVYFLYFGQLYVKWTRFMSPLFFVIPLVATIFIKRFPKLLIIAIIPGLFFLTRYFVPDSRFLASEYLVKNLPPDSAILSESGNVVDIPVLTHHLNIINYDFYKYNPQTLSEALTTSNYIIIPSRRVFMNYDYKYYQNLFNGSLGFEKIKEFSPIPDLFLNPENAEETWSVFDRPTIRLYKKIQPLNINQYEKLL